AEFLSEFLRHFLRSRFRFVPRLVEIVLPERAVLDLDFDGTRQAPDPVETLDLECPLHRESVTLAGIRISVVVVVVPDADHVSTVCLWKVEHFWLAGATWVRSARL